MADLQKVAQKKFDEIAEPVILIAYMQHILDLQGKLIADLAGIVDQTKVTTAMQGRLDLLNTVLAESSIDFANIATTSEAYKIPNAVAIKKNGNQLMKDYIKALVREGKL